MNIKDVLSPGEELLVKAQQGRYVPGGKEVCPAQIAITNQRIIIETSTMLGLKKDYQSFSYADIMEVELKKNVFSSNLIISSRFKGQLHIESVKHNQAQQIEQIINQYINNYRYGAGNQNQNQPSQEQQGQQKKGGF